MCRPTVLLAPGGERQIFGCDYQHVPDICLRDDPRRKADKKDRLPSPALSCPESGRCEKRDRMYIGRISINGGRNSSASELLIAANGFTR
jgi:hypothetical protein